MLTRQVRGSDRAIPTAAQVRQHHTATSLIHSAIDGAPLAAVEEALSGLITAGCDRSSIHAMFQRLERAADRGL